MKALRTGCAACLLAMGLGAACGDDTHNVSGPAAALAARFAELESHPVQAPFQVPIHLNSSEGADRVSGEINALVSHPFAVADHALDSPSRWCEILMLHLNTKSCRVSMDGPRTVLHMAIGKKYDQPVQAAYPLDFTYRVAAETATYLKVDLDAQEGPLGTSDYRIVLEAAPAEGERTLLRLSYSYAYGPVARIAMQIYLVTLGRNKVGFTVVGRESDGEPRYIGGMRGVVERNTMRYYLAVEAYLGALSAAPPARREKSLGDWFAAIERYPRQLHEMERGEYLDMKRKEYSRLQTADAAGASAR